jgi:hypothetical protein
LKIVFTKGYVTLKLVTLGIKKFYIHKTKRPQLIWGLFYVNY